jgi:hypothetical protein
MAPQTPPTRRRVPRTHGRTHDTEHRETADADAADDNLDAHNLNLHSGMFMLGGEVFAIWRDMQAHDRSGRQQRPGWYDHSRGRRRGNRIILASATAV